ncbi:MAG TPA: XrtA/PEP-CTERM system histidine kinase PrsK, partial [Dissulfurispiraceae bacterium]|nr:XrtA/PEP-CTERM system histidine kinase PrsK [Dissulfurispiraceae bacterium]
AGDVRLSISRKTAYRSVVVFLVGIYLIGLGLLGEGMKYIGRESQNKLLVSVAFVAAIGLLLVLFSEKAKRRITVFLHKNFYQNKFDYRVQWLQFTDRLASAKTGEDLLTSILEGFRDTFGMSGAALFFFDEDRRVYALRSSIGIASPTLPMKTDDALIRYIKEMQWVLNVHDDNADIPADNREFLIGSDIIFLVPLFFGESLGGFIALGRPINPREVYTYEDYDLMKTLARQAASAILNLKLSEELAESRQMEAVGKISAFVLHDLKNLVSALSLMMENAKDYMDDPDFQRDMIRSLDNTVSKMKRLIERLKTIQDKDTLRYENVDLRALVLETASLVTTGQITVSGEGICVDVDREEMQKVILNLLLNGIEACNGKGTVSADVGPLRGGDNGSACIRVSDTGSGMSEEFIRNSLFKPFVTTKGKGLGIGLYQCRQIVEAHRGRIDVKSEVGKGSVFTVILPKSANQACLLHGDE